MSSESRPVRAKKPGLVMLCDVDFGFPDAMRTHTVEVARSFAGAGLDVDLVARGADQHIEGVAFKQASGSDEQRLRRLGTISLSTIRLLWQRRNTAERFYVRTNWTCMPAMVAARVLGYRVVTQVDGIPYGDGYPILSGSVKRGMAVAMGRLSNGILAVSPEIKQLLVRLARIPPERISVVPNGVDVDFFRPISRREAIERCGLDPTCTYATFCGGFHPWFDFDLLLRSFAAVARERPDARLLLVGDGPERSTIDRIARELRIEDVVTITGMIHDRARVRDYLGASTLTLVVYRPRAHGNLASPIKLMEYLAAGRAVLAVELPGARAFLEDNGCGVVLPGTLELIVDAIRDLLDPERADELGAAGRRLAEEDLSWHSVIERTLPLFGL